MTETAYSPHGQQKIGEMETEINTDRHRHRHREEPRQDTVPKDMFTVTYFLQLTPQLLNFPEPPKIALAVENQLCNTRAKPYRFECMSPTKNNKKTSC